MRRMLAATLGLAVLGGACSSAEKSPRATGPITTLAPSAEPPSTTPTEVGGRSGPAPVQNLVAFDDCADVVRWTRAEALKTGFVDGFASFRLGNDMREGAAFATGSDSPAAGSPDAAASAPAARTADDGDTSGTNNQEKGVDEADFVKTDGRILAAVASKFLRVAVRDGSTWRKAGKLELPDESGEVLLVGDRALILQSVQEPIDPQKGEYRSRALLMVVDLSNPNRPVLADRYDIDGQVQTARLIEGRVHVVVSTQQPLPFIEPVYGSGRDQAAFKAATQAAIRRSTIKHWVPTGRHFNGTARPGREVQAVPCGAVSRPASFGGNTTVSVLSIDPAESAKPTAVASVVGVAAQNVYVSPTAVYVTSQRYSSDIARLTDGDRAVGAQTPETDVHRFELTSASGAKYQGSGRIAGLIRDRYSMSEHEGVLRVVASNGWGDASQTSVFTVRPERDVLAPLGVVNGIGIAEQVQSVRFIGPFAYVVTFRRIDPLHVIDLRDPARPRLRGELKVPGFSSYLHPIGETRLLGVGHSATDEGRTTGLQLALFDISNPDAPREIKTIPVAGQQTEVDNDPRAFMWWQPRTLAAFPVLDYPTNDGSGNQGGQESYQPTMHVVGFRVVGDELSEVGRLPQRGQFGGPTRSIVSGPMLLTVTRSGVQTSQLAGFAETGWLAFSSW